MRAPLVLTACSAFILLCAPAQYLGRQQDDLLYLSGALSLLEGKFLLLTVVGQPPLAMINPGFPALLAPLAFVAGERWGIYQAFCALLLASAPWVLFAWLKRRTPPASALLLCALFAASPVVLSQAGTVMSEGPFLLCALGLLLFQGGAAAGLWLLAATQIRTAAGALLPAALARPLAERRWGAAAWAAAPSAAGLALFSLWSRRASGSVQKLQELGVSYAAGPARVSAVVLDNARYYLSSWGSFYLPSNFAEGPAAAALGAVLAALALRGALQLLRRDRFDPAVWMLGATAVLHALWPWQYERYLIMPLPLMLWCLHEGAGRRAQPLCAALLAAQAAFQSRTFLGEGRSWRRPELERTYQWLREKTPPSEALASALYLRDGFLAGRPSAPLPDAGEPEEFHEALKKRKVKRVLEVDGLDLGLSARSTAVVQGLLDAAARDLRQQRYFTLVYQNPDEGTRVYELK